MRKTTIQSAGTLTQWWDIKIQYTYLSKLRGALYKYANLCTSAQLHFGSQYLLSSMEFSS